jgi:hypothetical protein
VNRALQWFESVNRRGVGISIIKSISEDLLASLHFLENPLGKIEQFILDHFRGHSPPPLGPLHALNQLRIVETIASTLNPMPVVQAVRGVAGVTAAGVPLMMAPALAGWGWRGGDPLFAEHQGRWRKWFAG